MGCLAKKVISSFIVKFTSDVNRYMRFQDSGLVDILQQQFKGTEHLAYEVAP